MTDKILLIYMKTVYTIFINIVEAHAKQLDNLAYVVYAQNADECDYVI